MTKCADIDVVNAAGEIYAGERSQSDVVRPGIACQRAVADGGVVISEGIIKKCFTTTGCILDAICILKERLNTGRRVAVGIIALEGEGTGRRILTSVPLQCKVTGGSVKVARRVSNHRTATDRRVAATG